MVPLLISPLPLPLLLPAAANGLGNRGSSDGISLVNSPGTIDADYRGPLGIIIINHGDSDFQITHGMRIAQMVAAPVVQAQFCIVSDLDETSRADGGFGSTGL